MELLTPDTPMVLWTAALALATTVMAGATIGLLVVAAKGLKSLKLAKKDILSRVEREAALIAAEKMEEFAQIIIRNNDVITGAREAKVEVFVQDASTIRFGTAKASEVERARKWVLALPEELRQDMITLLNDVEAWSGYFMSGLADEKVAFGPCAPTFCSFVVQSYGLLLAFREQHNAGKFPNSIGLFRLWRARLDAEKRGATMGELLERLNELHAGQVVHEPPQLLGTNLE